MQVQNYKQRRQEQTKKKQQKNNNNNNNNNNTQQQQQQNKKKILSMQAQYVPVTECQTGVSNANYSLYMSRLVGEPTLWFLNKSDTN